MSGSNFTINPASSGGFVGFGKSGQPVQVTTLPDTLQNNARGQRLEGQITQVNNNNTVRIQTEAGSIDVKVRGNRTPEVGQRVAVDVPAGNPPRQVTLRDATPAPQSQGQTAQSNTQTTTPAPVRTDGSKPQIQNEQSRGNSQQPPPTGTPERTQSRSQPLPPALQEAIGQRQAAALQQAGQGQARPVTTDATVRLLSVPPAQAIQISNQTQAALPSPQQNILNRVGFQANLIATNATQQLSTQLTTQLGSALPQASQTNVVLTNAPVALTSSALPQSQPAQSLVQTPTTQLISQNLSTPLVQTASQASPTGTTQITPQPAAPLVLNATQTLPATQAVPLLQSQSLNVIPTTAPPIASAPVSTANAPIVSTAPIPLNISSTLTPLPVTFDPTNPAALTNTRVERIDIQILQIKPPEVLLQPVTRGTNALIPPAAINITPPLIGNAPATAIPAVVTGFTQNGLPLVTAQLPGAKLPQSFILQFKSNNLALGSQLQIAPKLGTQSAPILTQLPNLSQSTNPLLRGFQWPALDQLYTSLQSLSPQAAAALTRSIPNAANPTQLAPAAMMFIAAVRSGDFGNVLGNQKIEMLERAGRGNILRDLVQNTSNLARGGAVEPATSGDWRAVPLPMFWEGEIHRITLFTRNEDNQGQQNQEKGGQTRFVFDLALTRMGDVQLDGLIQDKRLDLVVRTQNAFSEPMQQTMRQAYSHALDQTELSGELNFQGSMKNRVNVNAATEQLGVDA